MVIAKRPRPDDVPFASPETFEKLAGISNSSNSEYRITRRTTRTSRTRRTSCGPTRLADSQRPRFRARGRFIGANHDDDVCARGGAG
jgi:hypothetical protein